MLYIKKILIDKNIRVTKNKIKLLKYLIDKNGPVTAVEIKNNFSKESNLNKSTIYRIMEELYLKGVVFKFLSANGEYMYCFRKHDGSTHVHLICDECGEYYCKDINPKKLLDNFEDFHAVSISAILHGICSNCIKK